MATPRCPLATPHDAPCAERVGASRPLAGGRAEGDSLRVTVTYSTPTAVPLVGALVGDVSLTEQVTVRVE